MIFFLLTGPVFGNRDFFTGLAIFLDTYSNHNGPHNVRKSNIVIHTLLHSLCLNFLHLLARKPNLGKKLYLFKQIL